MSDTITDVTRAALRNMTYDQLTEELTYARLEQHAHERCGRAMNCHAHAENAVNALLDEWASRHVWKGPRP